MDKDRRQRIQDFIKKRHPTLNDPFAFSQKRYTIEYFFDIYSNKEQFLEYYDVFNIERDLILPLEKDIS